MDLFKLKQNGISKKMSRVVFTIKGMHCVACAMNIDGELEDTPGVKSATTNYARARCEVEYDPERMTLAKIQGIVKKIGYDLSPQES